MRLSCVQDNHYNTLYLGITDSFSKTYYGVGSFSLPSEEELNFQSFSYTVRQVSSIRYLCKTQSGGHSDNAYPACRFDPVSRRIVSQVSNKQKGFMYLYS